MDYNIDWIAIVYSNPGGSVFHHLQKTRKRLNARSKDLLEVSTTSYRDQSWSSRKPAQHILDSPSASLNQVDFLHRTVHDFLRANDIQKSFASCVGPDFYADLLLCKAYLAQL
jgi:hypothetical protein